MGASATTTEEPWIGANAARLKLGLSWSSFKRVAQCNRIRTRKYPGARARFWGPDIDRLIRSFDSTSTEA